MNTSRPNIAKDELPDSWVDVQNDVQTGIYSPLNIEKLLKEAQDESSTCSRESSARGSPKGLHSPTSDVPGTTQDGQVEVGTDWVWDWSSRPEKNPAEDMVQKYQSFRHPARHNGVNKQDDSLFRWKNVRILILSHTFFFALGAAVSMIFLRKYCHWSRVSQALD